MTISIAIVCDAPADRITIATLAERVIREAAPWIEPEAMGDYVEWRGFRRADSHLEWTAVKHHLDELKLVVRFRKVEQSLQPYSQAALRAIRVLARGSEQERIDAIILVPDSDGDKTRMDGLVQARDYASGSLPIIIGMAYTKRECWHVCGFEAESEDENEILAELRSELGPDIRSRTEELTAKSDDTNNIRSAKRVLLKLCGGDPERESRCLTALPIAKLKERGANNGLAAFLGQLEERLVPLFAPRSG